MYCRCLDFISVMTYDFHGGWEHVTGSHNALYSSPRDVGPHTQLNQACLSFYLFYVIPQKTYKIKSTRKWFRFP